MRRRLPLLLIAVSLLACRGGKPRGGGAGGGFWESLWPSAPAAVPKAPGPKVCEVFLPYGPAPVWKEEKGGLWSCAQSQRFGPPRADPSEVSFYAAGAADGTPSGGFVTATCNDPTLGPVIAEYQLATARKLASAFGLGALPPDAEAALRGRSPGKGLDPATGYRCTVQHAPTATGGFEVNLSFFAPKNLASGRGAPPQGGRMATPGRGRRQRSRAIF